MRKKILGPGAGKRIYNIRLSNEQLIFIFIGLVILLVTCFSLGVERGKRIVMAGREPAKEKVAVEKKAKTPIEEKISKEPVIVKEVSSPYVIQMAAYKDSKQAEKEKKLLEKKGYVAEVAKSGKYSIVYVAGFSNMKEAESIAKKLKSRYNDCFIKRRQ
ncbi:MAG: SPOR domain-containing protein [Candidatus Omnitrophota bacterium]|nr:MAG: SPOR domain-containing protein [Candidatus Omnitrophota bacterium]